MTAGHTPTRVACTIIDSNYAPQARVMAGSYLQHHPDHRFVTLLIDTDLGEQPAVDLPGEVFTLADLALPEPQLRQMMAIYDVLEFATALKAALLQRLVEEHRSALYLDPDMLLLGRLDDMFDAAEATGIALTPHVLTPLPRDGLEPAEDRIRHSGIFNLGMVAVGQGGREFLAWWAERLATEAVVDLPRALFTDQRWVDWAPALWEPTVLRDPGLNVAYWNLHERPLNLVDGVLHAGGARVRLMHFSGYDPSVPWQLSKHAGALPRVRLAHDPVLRSVCDAYGAALAEQGWPARGAGYRWASTPDGVRITPAVRAALRRACSLAATGADSLPANAFAPGALREWIDSPAPGQWGVPVGRWALAFYESEVGVQHHFPRLDLDDAVNYQRWLAEFPLAVAAREAAGLGTPPAPLPPVSAYEREAGGWNMVAYMASEHGVGESGRRLLAGLERTGVPVHVVGLTAAGTRNEHRLHHGVAGALRFRDSVYCVNADMLPGALARLEHYHRTQADARRIALWFWELATMPAEFADALATLEQVWVTSEFTAQAVRSLGGDVPVHVVTLPVSVPQARTPFGRAELGLPEGYLVTTCFDHHSVFARKNPLDVVRAFRLAFPLPGEASLVIKAMNGAHHPLAADQLQRATEDRPDITVVDATWSAASMTALLELSDCFVSLHRSEGFGLNIADAMALGTPVVTTGYSGNMRFCTADTTCLVPYELVEVGAGNKPYDSEALWAQPDVEAAAALLRRLFEQPEAAAAMAARAREHIVVAQAPAAAAAEMWGLLHGQAARRPRVELSDR